MNLRSLLIALSLSCELAMAQDLTLKGILATPERQLALVEAERGFSREVLLAPQQRDGEIELTAINAAAGTVKVRHAGREQILGFASTNASSSGWTSATGAPSLRLEDAGMEMVSRIYAELSDRMVLRSSFFPAAGLSLVSYATNDNELCKAIESGLAEQKILFQHNRDKFVIVGRKEQLELVTPKLWETANVFGSGMDGSLPAGVIDFRGVEPGDVLTVFQELVNRTLLRANTIPRTKFWLYSNVPLTRSEAIYVFAAMLALSEISLEPVQDEFALVFWKGHTNQVKKLLARPSVVPWTNAPATNASPGMIDFKQVSLKQVATFFSNLLNQPVEVAASAPHVPLTIRSQTELSQQSLLRGLELLLGINNLVILPKEPGPGLMIERDKEASSNRPQFPGTKIPPTKSAK